MQQLPQSSFYRYLKHYDLTITTSFLYKHGISGHVFEIIEYYWIVKQYTNLTPCVLLSDGTTKEEFAKALHNKYTDIDDILDHTYEHHKPALLFTKNLLIVDGSWRGMNRSQVFAETVYIFRCAEDNFDYFNKNFKNVVLLQDFNVYGDNNNAIDYNKKILFSRLRVPKPGPKNTAMLYLTSNCRGISTEEIERIVEPYDDYVILTNTPELYNNAYEVPVDDLWELFDTYVYTNIPKQWDCSSRFIKECEYFGRDVVYEIDYTDKALNVRINNTIEDVDLNENDYFIELLNAKHKQP
jgi:hypothetical protein